MQAEPSLKTFSKRRIIKRMLILFGAAVILWAVIILTIQRSLLFPSWIVPPPPAKVTLAPPMESWLREVEGVTVEAWFIAGQGVSEESPGPAVVFAHGNGEVIDQWPSQMRPYVERGISVLLVEYRGYGRSTGKPSQKAITDDFAWFHDKMIQRPEVDPALVIFHGRSLGGGVVGSLAKVRKPKAIILESTFTSVRSMAWSYMVPGFMMRDPFDTLATLRDFDGPVLIYHGQEDEIIPVKHAHRLAEVCRDVKLVIDAKMTHNSGPTSIESYWDAIDEVLRQAGILHANEAAADH